MRRSGFLKILGAGSLGSILARVASVDSKPDKILKPKGLKEGDTIGLVSPASRLPREKQYDEIAEQVKDLGYKVKLGPNSREQYGYLGGHDKQRAEDINAMFADDSIDAIMAFRGGWGSNRILDLIDYELIKKNPKIFIGFSDITSLLLAIYVKTGLITFHGPVGKSDWTDYTKLNFQRTLSYEQTSLLSIPEKELCEDCRDFYVITTGKATGRLLGGNLSVLTSMMGSDYLPEWKDSILFLEDVGEDIYRIDRMLTQLKLNGVLDQISGFVFGQCTDCERSSKYSLTLEQVFEDHIKPLGIPAFSGAMFGHLENMLTLPVGIKAEINAQSGSIILKEPATI